MNATKSKLHRKLLLLNIVGVLTCSATGGAFGAVEPVQSAVGLTADQAPSSVAPAARLPSNQTSADQPSSGQASSDQPLLDQASRGFVADGTRRQFSLAACFERADSDNKEIKTAAADLSVAEANKIIAKAIPNPNFNLTYGFGPAWRYVAAGNNQQFGWTEEVLVAGKRTKKFVVAQASLQQKIFQLEAVRFDIHNRVYRAYMELAAAAAYARLIEDQRATAVKLADISKKRFDAGKAPGSEVLQAKLGVMQFAVQRNQAQARIVQDSVQLAQLLGETPHTQEIILVDDNSLFSNSSAKKISMPDPEGPQLALQELLPTAWRERKDLKAAFQQACVARKTVTLTKSQRIPDPTVGFDYLFSTYKPYQTRFFNPTGTGLDVPANKVPSQPGYLLTYSQEQPIFHQYQGQIKASQATYAQLEKQNDLLRLQIASSILVAYEALIVASDNIRHYKTELLPSAANVARLTRRGYELGQNSLASAILAQQQYQQTRASYFDAVVLYQNAWADLERAVGVPLRL
jgi:cobalt-zinc-cadmium efflux system outer membrane protein